MRFRKRSIVFNLDLPVLLFRDVANSSIDEFFDGIFVVYSMATTSQACFRSNYEILGLPLISHVLGDAHTGLGLLPLTFEYICPRL